MNRCPLLVGGGPGGESKMMWMGDIAVGLFLLAFSAIALFEAVQLPKSHIGISPGFFPTIAFAGLILLNLVLVFRGLQERRRTKQGVSVSLRLNWKNLKKIVVFVLFAWLYVLLLSPLGFVYASGIFFWVIFILAGVRHWGKALVFSFGSSIALYLLFYRVFMVVLPRPTLPIPCPF